MAYSPTVPDEPLVLKRPLYTVGAGPFMPTRESHLYYFHESRLASRGQAWVCKKRVQRAIDVVTLYVLCIDCNNVFDDAAAILKDR